MIQWGRGISNVSLQFFHIVLHLELAQSIHCRFYKWLLHPEWKLSNDNHCLKVLASLEVNKTECITNHNLMVSGLIMAKSVVHYRPITSPYPCDTWEKTCWLTFKQWQKLGLLWQCIMIKALQYNTYKLMEVCCLACLLMLYLVTLLTYEGNKETVNRRTIK